MTILKFTFAQYFSYGHFFQMPPMYAMYQNNSFLVDPNDYVTTMGNTLLEPEKTITYELGLWQGLSRNLSLDVALFYRDIYNLLSTKIITTYNQVKYGLYSNKDYGNVRGLELKLDLGQGSIILYSIPGGMQILLLNLLVELVQVWILLIVSFQ